MQDRQEYTVDEWGASDSVFSTADSAAHQSALGTGRQRTAPES